MEQATEGRQTPVFKPLNVRGDDSGQYVFRLKLAESEASNWERLKNAVSIAALLEFLEKYPNGKNVQEAIRRIEQLEAEDQAAWEMAEQGDSLGSYLKYIHLREEGRHLEAARKKVEEFRAGNKGKAQKINPAALISFPNTFTDPRDGQTYRTVELNGQHWMAQNLNFDVGDGCWFYKEDPKNGEKYGRLYTWEAAKKACPQGWRLPTDEEWRALAMAYGGLWDGSDKGDPKKAYKALLEGGDSGFSALLGGYRYTDGSFRRLGDYGRYWSATESGGSSARFYAFDRNLGKLFRNNIYKGLGLSCRCVQNAPSNGID
ncbi:MAG: fibrobacter succinogenes major paralogous domain-containing protein [Phaeodactylibacter sp.]|nr:fibrobacter succinogenes major paralogous domain-containing protein [Phaeodactylibacter sp.]